VIGTDSGDGGNVDCYVITNRTLKTGQIVECDPIGLMEQFEDACWRVFEVPAYPLRRAAFSGEMPR
jgi:inorganic pyrophosphatase